MKNIGEVTKKAIKVDDKLEGRVCALERLLGKVKKYLEVIHGADVDGDGKVGMSRIKGLIVIALASLTVFAGVAMAAEEVIARFPAPEGKDAVIEINADEGDDAADIGELIMTTSGTMKVDVGGTTAATFTTSGITADIVGSQAVVPLTSSTSTNITLTSASYGTTTLVTSNVVMAVVLPANGAPAGSWLEVAVGGSDACAPTISAATADTLVGPNDIDLDSVTWATGHRINAVARFWSDGSFWHVQNLGGTTMTYTD